RGLSRRPSPAPHVRWDALGSVPVFGEESNCRFLRAIAIRRKPERGCRIGTQSWAAARPFALSGACIRAMLPDLSDRTGMRWGTGRTRFMGIRTAVAAGTALLMSGLAAHALDTSAKASSKLSADALWAKIGDFCGISKWHPAVEK